MRLKSLLRSRPEAPENYYFTKYSCFIEHFKLILGNSSGNIGFYLFSVNFKIGKSLDQNFNIFFQEIMNNISTDISDVLHILFYFSHYFRNDVGKNKRTLCGGLRPNQSYEQNFRVLIYFIHIYES